MPDSTYTGQGLASNTRLIGVAGKKQSGKTATANFIAGINLVRQGYIEEFNSNADGSLAVDGVTVEVNRIAPQFVKLYGYADYLKNFVCDLFNVPRELAFGSDKDKETLLPHILWENMPNVMTNKLLFNSLKRFAERKESLLGSTYADDGLTINYHEPGPMTVRELLQYMGTDICRRMYSSCWVNALMAQIKKDAPQIAIIYDCRFDNEVAPLKEAGGLCIFLEKVAHDDQHSSEHSLTFNNWDAVIPNQDCKDIRCLNKLLYEGLRHLPVF